MNVERSDIFAAVRRNIMAVVPETDPAAISMDRTLAELGCNSIDRADIVTMTMDELGLVVPVQEFHQGSDIAGMVDLLSRHARA